MLREELKKLKTDSANLRKFGLTVGGVFVLLAAWFGLRHKPFGPYLLIPAVPLVVLGLVYPPGLKRIFFAWMTIGLALGTVVSTVLLTLLFYLVVTPIGLLARCLGKDFLRRKPDLRTASYWLPRDLSGPKPKSDYERQF
jgi:hypothetical protein